MKKWWLGLCLWHHKLITFSTHAHYNQTRRSEQNVSHEYIVSVSLCWSSITKQKSRLTSPSQVNFTFVRVFLKGGQQPRFRVHCSSVSFGKHRRMTSRVFILVDPFFISAVPGSAHLTYAQPATSVRRLQGFCLGSVARLRHVFGYCHPATAMDDLFLY